MSGCTPFRGVRLDKRTQRQVKEAERIAGKLTITQGSCNPGGVAASGGTHDGEGVVDFSVRGLTPRQIRRRVRALRRVGLWAWYRPAIPGVWGPHIHAVSVGNPRLAPLAKSQILDARRGRNGLRGHALDPHRGMGLPVITWQHYLLKHKLQRVKVCKGCRDRIPR